MVVAEKNETPCASNVEGRRSVGEGMLHYLRDTRVGNGGFLDEIVSRVTGCDRSKERSCGCHFLEDFCSFLCFALWGTETEFLYVIELKKIVSRES